LPVFCINIRKKIDSIHLLIYNRIMGRPVDEIQADLASAYAARRAALVGGESYRLDTGHGSQAVTRSLKNINAAIRELEAELAEAANPGGGILSPTFRRNP
jgi:hypothetical protein